MTITIELAPEIEAGLRESAARHGQEVGEYLRAVIDAHIQAVASARVVSRQPDRSLLELEGLGANLWKGMSAQEYVDALRDEWDEQQS